MDDGKTKRVSLLKRNFYDYVIVEWLGKGYDYFFFFRAKEEVGGSFGMIEGRDIDRRGSAAGIGPILLSRAVSPFDCYARFRSRVYQSLGRIVFLPTSASCSLPSHTRIPSSTPLYCAIFHF